MSFIAKSMSLSLTVKDLEASRHWYVDIVGFTLSRKMERDGVLRSYAIAAGDVRLLLNLDDGGRGWDRVKGEGFSINISTEQDVDALAASITAAGGILAKEPYDAPWGARVMRLVDPDGYRIGISKPLAK
jgi:catechol 2,3-dioxygenase-like lactoylglutathione lyase family enzyme